MEVEIETLKKAQINVSQLETKKDEEFKTLSQNLKKPAEVLDQLKEQW